MKKRALPVVILRSANNGFRAGLVLNTDQTGFKKSRGSERFQKNKQQTLLIMQRQTNTDASGQPFSPELVEAVWQKARTMGVHETLRVDAWGWTIVRSDYGNNRSRYGWEIDHILPVSQGGGDELTNLQPLQWENNRRKDEMMQGVIGSTRPDAQARQPRATKQARRK